MIVLNQTRREDLARRLRCTLLRALRHIRLKNTEVSLALVSDRKIQRLNRRYRKTNRPTDVLSFAQEESPKHGARLLGDIVLSVQSARRQAHERKCSLEEECDLLAVHGLLHLLGHDHATAKEATVMFGLQDRILRGIRRRA
ncbi:MAG TPA: rRNA maturation RNase YbeY [Bdellovibrionota bacterium]|nr:rRNA maturation RNase YbeY [Bdellovibrionota bacterium]